MGQLPNTLYLAAPYSITSVAVAIKPGGSVSKRFGCPEIDHHVVLSWRLAPVLVGNLRSDISMMQPTGERLTDGLHGAKDRRILP